MFEGLEIFVAVVDGGGFSAAAGKLGKSKSFVSKEVTRLENRLGARLLQRTTRAVTPTDIGRQFYHRCKEISEQAQAAIEDAMQTRAVPRGLLKISVPTSLGLGRLSQIMPEFLDLNPDVSIDFELNDSMVDMVSGAYDAVLRVGDLPDSGLIGRKLGSMRGLVVASPDFWVKHGKPEHPQELSGYPCITYSLVPNPEVWRFTESSGREFDVSVRSRVTTNNAEMECMLAIAGQGVARLPDFVCASALAAGQLEAVLATFAHKLFGIYVLYPHKQNLPSKTRAFLDFLTEKFETD